MECSSCPIAGAASVLFVRCSFFTSVHFMMSKSFKQECAAQELQTRMYKSVRSSSAEYEKGQLTFFERCPFLRAHPAGREPRNDLPRGTRIGRCDCESREGHQEQSLSVCERKEKESGALV